MEPNTPATQGFSQGNPTQHISNESTLNPPQSIQDTPKAGKPKAAKPKVGNTKNLSDVPARPKGPNMSAIVLGLIALVLAGAVIANETMDLNIDWSGKGPGAIVGIGILLVVLGAVGLVRRHDDT